ncbi:MAG: hypothetical protein Q9219_004059 [cf. Caloplaca sp. 3 TL-2023]
MPGEIHCVRENIVTSEDAVSSTGGISELFTSESSPRIDGKKIYLVSPTLNMQSLYSFFRCPKAWVPQTLTIVTCMVHTTMIPIPRSIHRLFLILSILYLLPILATPALSPRAETSANDTLLSLPPPLAGARPFCFDRPRVPSDPHFNPITRADCLELIFSLVSEPDADRAVLWNTARQNYPIRFGRKTCGISLYAGAPGMDLFSELDVAHAASLVIRTCNGDAQRGGLGGRMNIGKKNVFWIAVAGVA